jgi:hypothetical protein
MSIHLLPKVLLLSLMVLYMPQAEHSFKMAIFTLEESAGGLLVTARFDAEDFAAQPGLNKLHPEAVSRYLNEHFQVQLNSEQLNLQKLSLTEDGLYVELSALLMASRANESVKEVRIFNTCLTDALPGYSNIVKLKLEGSTRAFRMHKERTEIIATY